MASVLYAMLFTFVFSLVLCADPDPVQDVCVGIVESPLRTNGLTCKPSATADDFVSHLLREPVRIPSDNLLGSVITEVSATNFPGLNTQGISIQRFMYTPGGVVPPHVHPRSSELLYVADGTILAGFITTDNKLFQQRLQSGDVFIYPRGLIHFSVNVGETPALALASFNSQNPGTATLSTALFQTVPAIPPSVIARTFAVSQKAMESLKVALNAILT